MNKQYVVRLSEEERRVCQGIIKTLKGSSQTFRRAQILRKADAEGAGWSDVKIAEAFAGPFSFRKEVAKQAQNECKGCVPCGASLPRHAPMTQNPCMQTTAHETTAPSTPRGLL